jgi:hypothetical protein
MPKIQKNRIAIPQFPSQTKVPLEDGFNLLPTARPAMEYARAQAPTGNDPCKQNQMVLELRSSHDPTYTFESVSVVVSVAAFGAAVVLLFYRLGNVGKS